MVEPAGPPAEVSFIGNLLSLAPFLLCVCVSGFGEPFDRAEPAVPLGGEVGHGPGGLFEAVGFYLVENLGPVCVG